MNFANLSLPLLLAGAAGLAGLLYVLQQLRIRYTEVQVPTAMFWREAARDAPVRVFRRRFRHWLAYLLSLLICWLLWLGLAEPQVDDPDGGEFHVLFLDGSAHMAAADDLERASDRLRNDLRRLPEERREVIWGGAFNVKLLNAGEESLLLDRRLEGLAVEQAPSAMEEQLGLLALPGAYPESVRFVVYGRAPVSAEALDRLPESVTVERAGDFAEPGPNRGIVALGQGHAASARWDTVDVLVRIGATGGLSTESGDLVLSLDGAPLEGMVVEEAPPGGFVIRDVPAAGGVLEARLAEPDALPADDSAQLGLPVRRILKVAVSNGLGSVLVDTVSADPGLTLAEDEADLVFRQAGEQFGAGLPALEFALMDEQQAAFEIEYTGDVDAELVLLDSLQRLGLHLIDGAGLAAEAGREVGVQAAPGERRGVSVWAELLEERYNFTGSRSFPLFISRAARWLAEEEPAYAYLAAGRYAPEETSEFALAGPDNSATVLLGSELAPLRAGPLPASSGAGAYPVSLLSTKVSTAQAGEQLPSFSPSAVGLSGPSLMALLLVLAALALLAFEWYAYQRGLMP